MPSQNSAVQLSYQVCPIVLSGGAVAQIPGGMLPLLTLFGAGSFDLDDAFGAFNVLPGGTLISQTVAKYPFANQSVAANATIREPLTLSVIMDAPMRGPNAWAIKQMVMGALKATLESHNNMGGLYTVLTPAYMYTNMIMTAMTDNSRGNNSLPQNAWRFDFEKPLVALEDLAGAQNQLMGKISGGLPTDGSQTGVQPGVQTGQAPLGETAVPAPGTATSYITPNMIGGMLTGGAPGSFMSYMSNQIANYPALANPANFAFNGIS